jgi:hypothetical protein
MFYHVLRKLRYFDLTSLIQIPEFLCSEKWLVRMLIGHNKAKGLFFTPFTQPL